MFIENIIGELSKLQVIAVADYQTSQFSNSQRNLKTSNNSLNFSHTLLSNLIMAFKPQYLYCVPLFLIHMNK